jgi:hypothetical protein
VSRSRNSRRGVRSCRTHSRKGCNYCLHLRRHVLRARSDMREVDTATRRVGRDA